MASDHGLEESMSETATHSHTTREPSPWVTRFLAGAPEAGAVLDLACGRGRHMRYALTQGFSVTGLDRDISALADLKGDQRVRLIEADLEGGTDFPLKGERFGVVLVVNYLWRPILGDIAACVATDGILIYETFASGNERYGKPTNSDFLLKPNELIEAFAPLLRVIAFEEGLAERPYLRLIQRIAACGSEHPWAKGAPMELST